MSETDELRAEVAELRKAVEALTKTLAGCMNQGSPLGGGFSVHHYHHGQSPSLLPQRPHPGDPYYPGGPYRVTC